MGEGEGLRVYQKEGGRVSEEIRRQPKGGGRTGKGSAGRGEGKGKGDGMGKGSADTENLRRKSYLPFLG